MAGNEVFVADRTLGIRCEGGVDSCQILVNGGFVRVILKTFTERSELRGEKLELFVGLSILFAHLVIAMLATRTRIAQLFVLCSKGLQLFSL